MNGVEIVNVTMYDDRNTAEHLADEDPRLGS
jgi:hypothetical protein